MTFSFQSAFGRNYRSVDKTLLAIVFLLLLCGILAFLSASFGLLSRDGPTFSSVVRGQLLFGLLPGIICLFIFSKTNSVLWRKASLVLFIIAIVLNLALLVPVWGREHGGLFVGFSSALYHFSLPRPSKLLLYCTCRPGFPARETKSSRCAMVFYLSQ